VEPAVLAFFFFLLGKLGYHIGGASPRQATTELMAR
jgi:hypothetical protein